MGSAAYSAAKHAAVGLAEWLSIHYQKRGVRISCVCPAGVKTGFLHADDVYDQAVEAYMKAGAINQVPEQTMKEMSEIYKKSGWKTYVQANLDRVMAAPGGPPPPYVVSSFYVRLGQNDEAIKWLERAYEERDFRMIMITVSFEFDGLRSDPRFRDLVRRVGLPE